MISSAFTYCRLHHRKLCFTWLLLTALLVLSLSGTGDVLGQQKQAAPVISVDSIQAKLKQLLDMKELADEVKAKAAELYKQALEDVEEAGDLAKEIAHYELMIKTADSKLKEVEVELKKPLPDVEDAIPDEPVLPELEKLLREAEDELKAVRDELERLEDEPRRRQIRRKEVPVLKTKDEELLEEIAKQLQTPAPAGEDPTLTAGRATRLQARQKLAQQRLAAYDREIAAYDATRELLPKKRDLAARHKVYLEEKVQQLDQMVSQLRHQLAEEKREKARLEAMRSYPQLRHLALRNQELAEQNSELLAEMKQLSDVRRDKEQRLADLEKQFKSARDRISQVGLTEAMGLLLRQQRMHLPSVERLRRSMGRRDDKIREVQLALFDLEDERQKLAVPARAVAAVLGDITDLPDGIAAKKLEREAQRLLQNQKEFLDAVMENYNDYFTRLVQLNNLDAQLLQQTTAFGNYIDERILWVRSARVLSWHHLLDAGDVLRWLFNPDNWQAILYALGEDAVQNPVLTALAALVFAGWLWATRRLRRRLRVLGEAAAKGSCQSIHPTFEALLITLMLAGLLPALLFYLAWRLWAFGSPSEFVNATAISLYQVAEVMFFLLVFLQVCKPKGLAEAHFGWRKPVCSFLRNHLRWFIVVVSLCTLAAILFYSQDNELWKNSLGRMVFIVWMVVIAFINHIVLRPGGPIMQRVSLGSAGQWIYRLRWLWYALGVLGPLTLSVMAILGYFYTAFQMLFCLKTTAWYLLVLLLINALLLRWLLIHYRRLAFSKLQERKESKPAPVATDGELGPAAVAAEAAEPVMDLSTISEQSRRLLRFCLLVAILIGLWVIWSGVLPALRIMNQVVLWETVIAEQVRIVHLGHLMLAIVVMGAALLAIKNIPGLLELVLLQRLPLDAGVRYAITTLLRYVLFILGLVVAFQLLGITWSQYQWLVAAATVGLGFGLQEIFANFVSGIILLLERPIRVGDVVTVGEVTGTVTRIAMRYTIITDWDRKEYVVPNKDFVTGRVLNWTLTSGTNRVVIEVGVSYDSDPEQVRQILLQIARDNPLVLPEPEPIATFEAFADSSLHFTLRCFLPNLDKLLTIKHQIRSAILQRFREAGVEIPFPQRDLHIRTSPLAVSMPEQDGEAAR